MEHFSETAVLTLESTLIILVVNLSKNSHNFPLHGKEGWSFSSDTTKLKSFRGSLDNTMKEFYRVLGSEIGDLTWAWQREKQLIHMLMLSTNNESCVSSCLVCIKCIKCVQCGEDIQMLLTRTLATSASKSSIRRFVITEKAPTRAFSWLKAATTAFTFKTLLRHYAKRTLTPWSLNVKLGPQRNYHKGRAGWLTNSKVSYI